MNLRKIGKQILRGCTRLPYVGDHPGTETAIIFIILGGLAGISKGGLPGFVGGAIFMGIFIVPLYLYGAYERAQESDHIQEKHSKETE